MAQQRQRHVVTSLNFHTNAPGVLGGVLRSAEAVRLLQAAGAATHAEDRHHWKRQIAQRVISEISAEVVRLWAAVSDVNDKGICGATMLREVCVGGDVETVRLLIQAGADVHAVTENGDTALRCASRCGHVNVARALLAAGADVDAANGDGSTVLHHAIGRGQADVMRMLLGAYRETTIVPAVGDDCITAGGQPERGEHAENVRLLRAAGICHRGANGFDALLGSAAFFSKRPAMVRALLEVGANPRAAGRRGMTALHEATVLGKDSASLVPMLLAAGADVHAKNDGGATALHNAEIGRAHV